MPSSLHTFDTDGLSTDLLSILRRDVHGLNGLDVIEHHLPDSVSLADFVDLLSQVSTHRVL
jgi:hypothetical protein